MASTGDNPFPKSADVAGEPAAPAPSVDRDSQPNGNGTHGDVLGRVVQGAHDAIDRMAETAAPHVQRLQENVASANDKLHQRAHQAREKGDEWAESLRGTVRENPLAAVATALAIGLLIARLTR